MLAATAAANNKNALTTSLAMYRREMDRLSGPDNSNYVKPEEFAQVSSAWFSCFQFFFAFKRKSFFYCLILKEN